MLFGRNPETTVLDDLLRAARDGESSVRSVRGAAGIGKTTLLDWASEHAEGFLVLRAIGIEAETRWPFGGLHLLLRPLMKRIDDLLPEPLAKGLHRALALDGGEAGSAANIGMAVLQLLAEASEERPILCVVDDAQWMDDDSAQALLFASRRLYAERVVFLWGVREGDARPFPTVGIDDLPVGPVDDESALELLSAASPGLNESVRRHIVRIAGGNPLALLELATAHREGRAGVDGFTSAARHSATSLRQSFSERIDALPEATKRLLLLAAAETTGDLALVLKAGALFGTTLEDLAPAEAKELISTSGDEIGFSHPLIRTAAYFGAPLKERARAHRALADSVGGPETGCRRVYHLASAAPGPDESIATDLARKAAEDAVRGGHAAEADTYELAAELSADPAAKVERLLLGAEAAHKAGQSAQALKLSESVVHSSNDPAMLHRAHQVQAVIANWNGDKDASARHWFRSFEQQMLHDPASAGYPLFNVVETAIQHGDFALARSATERGEEHGLEHAPWVRLLLRGGLGLNRSGGVTLAEGGVRRPRADGPARAPLPRTDRPFPAHLRLVVLPDGRPLPGLRPRPGGRGRLPRQRRQRLPRLGARHPRGHRVPLRVLRRGRGPRAGGHRPRRRGQRRTVVPAHRRQRAHPDRRAERRLRRGAEAAGGDPRRRLGDGGGFRPGL
ncbi:AAA family ATPase [Salininema proteolyticum]|uniref:AAA family ATPase n=1 Tax=Salininema proteolyticum TaxID=1607685 RepID=UPI0036320DCB